MVSNANDDLPLPDKPVITTSLSRGISTSTFLRLCTRAPVTSMLLELFFIRTNTFAVQRYKKKRTYTNPNNVYVTKRNKIPDEK